jgi:AcrR family transcriptional regulator
VLAGERPLVSNRCFKPAWSLRYGSSEKSDLIFAYDRSAIFFGMTDGRKTRGDRSRAIVLDRGVVLATTKGLNSFSVGELAERSGIAKANVSVLFGSKADLQVAITDLARSRFSERVLDPVRLTPAGLGRLLALGECWFDYLSDPRLLGGCFFSAAMFELDAQPGALRDTIRSDMSAWVQAIAAMIADAAQLGQLRGDVDPADEAVAFFSLGITTNALIQLGVTDEPVLRARRLWNNAIDRMRAVDVTAPAKPPTTRKVSK